MEEKSSGIKDEWRNLFPVERVRELMDLFKMGLPLSDLMKQFGFPGEESRLLFNKLIKFGLIEEVEYKKAKELRGEDDPNRKRRHLGDDEIVDLVGDIRRGEMTYEEIEKKYNRGKAYVINLIFNPINKKRLERLGIDIEEFREIHRCRVNTMKKRTTSTINQSIN